MIPSREESKGCRGCIFGVNYELVTYEGYGPNGTAILWML